MACMGGLPWLVAQPGFKAQIYATYPIHKIGQTVIVDTYLSRANYEHIKSVTFDEILQSCEKIKPLKFQQKMRLFEIEISPYRAGHSLGGSAWKITFNLQDIVYAPTFNPHGERHLDGLDFESLKHPTVLITNPKEGQASSEIMIMEKIINTFLEGGNVLIPITTAGRALELLLVIDHYWDRNRDRLESFNVAFLGNMAHQTIEYAKSHLEYMPESLRVNFETNPFQLNYVKFVHSEVELPEEPICVLSTLESLEFGYSNKMMQRFANDSNNLVLFIEKPEEGSLAHQIYESAQGTVITIENKMLIERAHEAVSNLPEDLVRQISEEAEMPTEEVMEIESDLIFPMFPKWTVKADPDQYGELVEMEWDMGEEAGEDEESGLNAKTEMTPFIQLKEVDDRRIRYGACQTTKMDLDLNWNKAFIPLEGLPDFVGYKLTVAQLRPKNLILLSKSESLEGLYGNIIKYIPLELEMMPVRPITINEDLYSSLTFQMIDHHDVAYIKGDIVDESTGLSFVPPREEPYTNSSLFLGDLDMFAFKQKLAENGLQAEFHEGCLVVKTHGKPRIKIFKEQGKISFESVICKEYFQVRKLLYSNLVYI